MVHLDTFGVEQVNHSSDLRHHCKRAWTGCTYDLGMFSTCHFICILPCILIVCPPELSLRCCHS
jgi:hypothetical protein